MRTLEDAVKVNDKYCVKFVPHTNEDNYIEFISDTGCYSYVGKQATLGSQAISLGTGCIHPGIIQHELLHALGFLHEQSRPDRDNYVRINFNNIRQGMEINFQKFTSTINTFGLPYDYASILHYSASAFSVNGLPTIEVRRPGVSIGQRTALSSIDKQAVQKFYRCDASKAKFILGLQILAIFCFQIFF
jgi:hypothetical protein